MSYLSASAAPSDRRKRSFPLPVAKQTYVSSVHFTGQVGFRKAVNERVEAFLTLHQIKTRDIPAMYLKGAIMLVWWGVSLALWTYSGIANWHWALPPALSLSFALATVGIGFNVMHDANHSSYSNSPTINRLLGYSSEVVGLSNFIWRQQHNVWHHTYPNIAGLDEALETDGWLRSSPRDVWKPLYRFQHFYAPVVYALAGIGLMLIRNFTVYIRGRYTEHFVYPKMSGNDRLVFWAGRAFNLSIYVVVPLLIFPWWLAIISFLIFSFTAGTVMAHVLMLAHVSDELEFAEPTGDPLQVENEWAVHQVIATLNFAPRNPSINWYVGGLNYQIEHHLFPQMCQLVYPKIAGIVEQTCKDFGVPYRSNPSFVNAIVEHYRSLKVFGRRPALD